MDVERLKCKQCGKFPDGEIFECASKEHIVCVECAENSKKVRCACGAKLLIKKLRNPIEQLVNNVKTICRYVENGCTWKFTCSEMEAHVLECKFRPYRCIASSLNVLRCDWIGLQHEIENHLVECHKELGPVFRFAESSSMVFKENVSLGGLKVVDAFSKNFLFYFFSDAAKKTLSYMMVYFGRREESDQYFYELHLRSLPASDKPSDTAGSGAAPEPPVGVVHSVKFVERCYSDSENLTELLEDERCIVLTHRQVQKYLHNGKLFFSYKVRKVDGSGRERHHSEPSALNTAAPAAAKAKPRPPPFKFVEKGKASTNTRRSPSSSSTASTTSSSTSGGKSSGSSGSSSSEKTATTAVDKSASRSPSSASTVMMTSERNSAASAAGTLERSLSSSSSLSSINRNSGSVTPFEKPAHCPLLTPSINKLDLVSDPRQGRKKKFYHGGARGGGRDRAVGLGGSRGTGQMPQ
uniref:SIAH-type domain-containing protein n=1 Tax=Anopheles atroparvus TaxID=41427 RepID=A0AAG5DMD3_ANOAO